MYQISTSKPLAASKKYLPSLNRCIAHLKECVKVTNVYRARHKDKPVSELEIEWGCKLLKLNEDINDRIYEFVGPEKEINIANLSSSLKTDTSHEP